MKSSNKLGTHYDIMQSEPSSDLYALSNLPPNLPKSYSQGRYRWNPLDKDDPAVPLAQGGQLRPLKQRTVRLTAVTSPICSSQLRMMNNNLILEA